MIATEQPAATVNAEIPLPLDRIHALEDRLPGMIKEYMQMHCPGLNYSTSEAGIIPNRLNGQERLMTIYVTYCVNEQPGTPAIHSKKFPGLGEDSPQHLALRYKKDGFNERHVPMYLATLDMVMDILLQTQIPGVQIQVSSANVTAVREGWLCQIRVGYALGNNGVYTTTGDAQDLAKFSLGRTILAKNPKP
jgi:hypothetical protein